MANARESGEKHDNEANRHVHKRTENQTLCASGSEPLVSVCDVSTKKCFCM